MGTRRRTAGRFGVEALEGRWAPGGVSGGVLSGTITRSSGEEIPQFRAAHVVPLGGVSGGVLSSTITRSSGEEIPQRA
jgi:hypothetical protein